MFSVYEVELFHITSKKNYLADILTKLPSEVEEVEDSMRCLTEREANELLKHLTIPDNFTVSSECLQKLLREDSVKCVINEGRKEKKQRTGQVRKKEIYPDRKSVV